MTTTKADRLLRSVIDAGLSLTDFILLATKVIRLQHDFKTGSDDRRERDRKRQQEQRRDQQQFEQQLKEEEQRRMKGLAKLRELGYVTGEDAYPMEKNQPVESPDRHTRDKDERMKTDKLLLPYSKEINDLKQKQRDCCLTFNIDYDLRLNQQRLEAACRRAKRNIYEVSESLLTKRRVSLFLWNEFSSFNSFVQIGSTVPSIGLCCRLRQPRFIAN